MRKQIGENQVKIYSILLSLATSVLCVLNRASFYRVGTLLHSPIYLLCLAGEVGRLRLYVRFLNPNAADVVITRDVLSHSAKTRRPAKWRELAKSAALIAVAVIFFAFLIIAQGAPVLDHYPETFALSVLLTVLTVFPIVQFLGVQYSLQVFRSGSDLGFVNKLDGAYLDVCKVTAAGVLFGAWMGSIAYPLDWDRSWQAYPIPNVAGAIGGFAIANVYQLLKISGGAVKERINRSLGMD